MHPFDTVDMSGYGFQYGQCPINSDEYNIWSDDESDECLHESVEYVDKFNDDDLGDDFVGGSDSNYSISENDEIEGEGEGEGGKGSKIKGK